MPDQKPDLFNAEINPPTRLSEQFPLLICICLSFFLHLVFICAYANINNDEQQTQDSVLKLDIGCLLAGSEDNKNDMPDIAPDGGTSPERPMDKKMESEKSKSKPAKKTKPKNVVKSANGSFGNSAIKNEKSSTGANPAVGISSAPEVLSTFKNIDYPPLARKRGQEGKVLLRASININGSVVAVEIIRGSGYGLLDNAALNAVKKWKFKPALKNGQPVEETLIIPVEFRLKN